MHLVLAGNLNELAFNEVILNPFKIPSLLAKRGI